MGYRKLPDLDMPDNPAILGYLAGMLDADGSISIVRAFDKQLSKSPSHSIKVSITNTDKNLCEWLTDTVKGGSINTKTRQNKAWKPAYNWCLYGKNAEQFLVKVLPFLIIKKERAELAIKLRSLRKGSWRGRQLDPSVVQEREYITNQMTELNRRGLVAVA